MPNLVQVDSSQAPRTYSPLHPTAIQPWRFALADRFEGLARFACLCTIVLVPLRYRINLQPRSYPPIYGDYTDLLLFAFDIPLLAALAFWAFSLVLRPRRLSIRPVWLSLCLAGITFFSLVSVLPSADPIISAFQLLRILALGGLYLLVINQFTSLFPLAIAAGIQVTIQAVIGSAQVFQQSSLGLQAFGEHILDPAQSGVSVVWSSVGRSLRAYGLTDHPNLLGGFLVFGLLIILGWLIQIRHKSISFTQLIAIGVFSLGSQALLLTFSRSAWVALLAGLLFWTGALLYTRSSYLIYRFVGLVGVAFLVCLPAIWSFSSYIFPRISMAQAINPLNNESRSLNERKLLNRAANDIFSQHALTGVGLGVYPLVLKAAQPDFPIHYQPAHFTILAAASEIGLFGALAYAAALIVPLVVYFVTLVSKPSGPPSHIFTTATALLLAIFIVGLFDYYPWGSASGRFWQWMAWGFWASAYRLRSAEDA